MSKKYEQLAKDIVRLVGGNENVDSLHHCQTRLRFKLVDDNKADLDAVSKLPGVPKALIQGGMFQVVIGLDVAECYEEVVKYITPKQSSASAAPAADSDAPKEKKKIFDIVTDFISSIFSPIVPALAGAGMVKALLALLVAFNLIDRSGQTYIMLNLFGDATFAFMPILLAYTTAQKLKCNPILAAVVAGIMCHSTWTGLVAAGEAVHFFGIPLYLVRYTNSVIPIVLVLLVQAPLAPATSAVSGRTASSGTKRSMKPTARARSASDDFGGPAGSVRPAAQETECDMKEFTHVIQDPYGLHVRTISRLIREAGRFSSQVQVHKGTRTVRLPQMLEMMSLKAKRGDSIYIQISGEDEAAASAALEKFLQQEECQHEMQRQGAI